MKLVTISVRMVDEAINMSDRQLKTVDKLWNEIEYWKRTQILIIIDICGSAVDLWCSANTSEATADLKSRRRVDALTTVVARDQKKIAVFPRSDKKFMVQLHTTAIPTNRLTTGGILKKLSATDTQKPRRYFQKNVIVMNGKHFTVEQTTQRFVPLLQPKRSRLMKKFEDIVRSQKTEKDKNKQELDNQKEKSEAKDIFGETDSPARAQLQELDIPTDRSDINNLGTNKQTRQTEIENSRYATDVPTTVTDVDAEERKDREEFLFLDGDAEEDFSDGPIRINLLDGILGQFGDIYEGSESVTEIELEDAEEDRNKRYVVEEENLVSTSPTENSSTNMESAMVYDMRYRNIN